MLTPLLLAFWLGCSLIVPTTSASAFASHRAQPASQPQTRTASTGISYGQFPDSPLGHFLYYLGQGRTREAQTAFSRLSTFEDRYRALTQAVYPGQYADGIPEVVTSCAGIVLKDQADPHRRAAIYCVLAKMNYALRDTDAALGHAQNAVQLNANSPWGWFWIAEINWFRRCWAAEAAARKRELSLFTGSTTNDFLCRAQIYHKLGLVYAQHFRQPETAIGYHYRSIDETMRLPADRIYQTYRDRRCVGAFMNILAIEVQALHDLPRAQQTLQRAIAMIPSFLSDPLDRAEILRLGLRLPEAGAPSE